MKEGLYLQVDFFFNILYFISDLIETNAQLLLILYIRIFINYSSPTFILRDMFQDSPPPRKSMNLQILSNSVHTIFCFVSIDANAFGKGMKSSVLSTPMDK